MLQKTKMDSIRRLKKGIEMLKNKKLFEKKFFFTYISVRYIFDSIRIFNKGIEAIYIHEIKKNLKKSKKTWKDYDNKYFLKFESFTTTVGSEENEKEVTVKIFDDLDSAEAKLNEYKIILEKLYYNYSGMSIKHSNDEEKFFDVTHNENCTGMVFSDEDIEKDLENKVNPFAPGSYYSGKPRIIPCYIQFIKHLVFLMDNAKSDEYVDIKTIKKYKSFLARHIERIFRVFSEVKYRNSIFTPVKYYVPFSDYEKDCAEVKENLNIDELMNICIKASIYIGNEGKVKEEFNHRLHANIIKVNNTYNKKEE